MHRLISLMPTIGVNGIHTLWSNKEARAGSKEVFPLKKGRFDAGSEAFCFSGWDLLFLPILNCLAGLDGLRSVGRIELYK